MRAFTYEARAGVWERSLEERALVGGDDLAERVVFVVRRDAPHLAHVLLMVGQEQELVLRLVTDEAGGAARFPGFAETGEREDSGEKTRANLR